MVFRHIRWRIALPYVFLVLCVMALVWAGVLRHARALALQGLEEGLLDQARLIAEASGSAGLTTTAGQELTLRFEESGGVYPIASRVTLLTAEGEVLWDSVGGTPSAAEEASGRSYRYEQEFLQARSSGEGVRLVRDESVGGEVLVVAVAIYADKEMVGAVRLSRPLVDLEAGLSRLRTLLAIATAGACLLALLLGLLLAERTARPVRWLTQAVQRLAAGDLGARLLPATRDEVGTLTQAFNEMSERLRQTIRSLDDQRIRMGSVLSNMADGVLITDGSGRVQLLNRGAERILHIANEEARGRSLAQVVRHHEVIDLWATCCQAGKEQVDLIELDREGTFLQVVATPLRAAEPQSCLIILQDLTHIRRLETIRRDFISNISHELRTPLAALRALADTLRDGALEDPPAARRFLDRIDAEVEALSQMVRELLELSRIESGQVPVQLTPQAVDEIVSPAVERMRLPAERAGLELTVRLPQDLPQVLADPERVQQVLTNLLSNAIKFTPSGGRVSVSAQRDREEVVISVEDTGIGIAQDELSRIFERFYKADRARSRGGTGLGLAIAKHIVQAHGGRIWAQSVEGQGSTFSFSLPVEEN